ncbi:50S ribosomal protein L25/general stress protein Ctc [Pararhizobium mangrovi]|uniref:Large ribosomal subunit protein bL25 n=1 Tax=Pararhizobium mangrovi TaxID=2590452 RepID=A0A506U883_9HYPH|nr:50S ribosomal protein L25/general stress protein Ctc [Pararhizobium mangrovi]TPW29304.1 50S ribosomal protein L25/general stress protein Ctc [Pararhizobium mangrovi]
MSEPYELKAETRERVGKGSARELRRNGKIPAVIYGDRQEPLPIALPYKDVTLKIHGGGFLTTLATIDLDGKKIRVLPKTYDLDPVRDFTVHVDFLRVSRNTKVTVEVPVHYLNEEASPGIERGGVLAVVRHTVEVTCPANEIPDSFEVDLTGLEINDSVHVSAITLPDAVELTITDRDFTLASISSPAAMKSDEAEEEAEGEETEVAEEDLSEETGAADGQEGEGGEE